LDVGVKIFTGLNVSRGLPIPVVIRYDYHGNVPGAKERAIARCENLDLAFRKRFSEQAASGMLHTLLVVRDCHAGASIEVIASSAEQKTSAGAH
ncbi:MAG: carboxysome shell carbonic anhydrase, partial [Gammaproteobacteria bacterium]|nr:carboxysome shell carbonic anhydrase [Gammaproteobacteria bacterium]